jgi:ribulose-5-phosphate 4-epimerase/fuculose-1-phosphate aldolase
MPVALTKEPEVKFVDRADYWDYPGPQPTIEEERLFRKQRLAAAFRLFARHGFDHGVAGHITARDPELHDHFWVNPLAVHFGQIRVSDLLLVNDQGEVVHGKRPVNRAAFAIHRAIHHARPDVVAAAHTHSVYGKVWSTYGRLLDPITQDACVFYNDHAVFDDYTGVVLDIDEGDRIAAALGPRKAVILKNHGILAVGKSVEAAAWYYISLEDACHTQLLAEASGTPQLLSDEVARHAAGQVGNPDRGWFSFQPLWDKITREEPDLFD